MTDPGGHALKGVGLPPLACWDCGFESRRGHWLLFLVSDVYCHVEVSATGRSLDQRSPTDHACVCVCHWLWSRATITPTSTKSRPTDVKTKKERNKQTNNIFKMNMTRHIDLIKWSWLNACVVGYKCLSIPPTFLFSSFRFDVVLNVGICSGAC